MNRHDDDDITQRLEILDRRIKALEIRCTNLFREVRRLHRRILFSSLALGQEGFTLYTQEETSSDEDSLFTNGDDTSTEIAGNLASQELNQDQRTGNHSHSDHK